MLAYLRYRLALVRLARRERQHVRAFRREFARVCRLPTEAERAEQVRVLAERDMAAPHTMEEARLGAMTGYLTVRGDRLMLPYPPIEDERYWRKSGFPGALSMGRLPIHRPNWDTTRGSRNQVEALSRLSLGHFGSLVWREFSSALLFDPHLKRALTPLWGQGVLGMVASLAGSEGS